MPRVRDDDDFELIDGVRCLKDGRTMRVSLLDARKARTRDDNGNGDDERRRKHKATSYDPQGRVTGTYEYDGRDQREQMLRVADSSIAAPNTAPPIGSRPMSITSGALDAARRENHVLSTVLDAMSRGPATRPQHEPPRTMAECDSIRRTAYDAMCAELRDAWKGKPA
jgi:hypothetical protein